MLYSGAVIFMHYSAVCGSSSLPLFLSCYTSNPSNSFSYHTFLLLLPFLFSSLSSPLLLSISPLLFRSYFFRLEHKTNNMAVLGETSPCLPFYSFDQCSVQLWTRHLTRSGGYHFKHYKHFIKLVSYDNTVVIQKQTEPFGAPPHTSAPHHSFQATSSKFHHY